MGNTCKHLKTIFKHKYYVCKYCFWMGLYWQGLTHDLSKFSPIEFLESVNYYTGYRSPIGLARKDKGYSLAWVHHYHHNKHHTEYWFDKDDKKDIPVRMPAKYFKEMIADIISASIAYNGNDFTWDEPLEYIKKNPKRMHPDTKKALMYFLKKFKKDGEDIFNELRDFDYERLS